MKTNISFDSDEFHSNNLKIYVTLRQLMKDVSLLHVSTIDTNNSFHFQLTLSRSNEILEEIKNFYKPYDKRRDEFEAFNKEKLIKDAYNFLNTDLY